MADLQPLKRIRDLSMLYLQEMLAGKVKPAFVNYDPECDSIMLLAVRGDAETVVHFLDDNLALVYDADTDQVVGLRIDGYRGSFLRKHRSVKDDWTSEGGAPFAKEVAKIARDALAGSTGQLQPVHA